MMMGRLPSLKTILLILICMGVLLILVFISQCQQQYRKNSIFTAPQPHLYQYQGHSQYLDKEMDYYRAGAVVSIKNQPDRKIFTEDWGGSYKVAKRKYNEDVHKNNEVLGANQQQQDQFKGDDTDVIHDVGDDKEMEVYHDIQPHEGQHQSPSAGIGKLKEDIGGGVQVTGDKAKNVDIRDISCDINNGRSIISCKASPHEVYIPFSFIESEFEISGHLDEKSDTFIWLHSQAKIIRPKGRYNPTGVFTYFGNYQVESRDRVKCISGKYGVPVSTQWSSQGYFYPIQIAQFGLSHFSKFLVEGEPHRLIIEDAEDIRGSWMPSSVSLISLSQDSNDVIVNNVVQMDNVLGNMTKNFSLKLEGIGNSNTNIKQLVLSWDMKVTKCPKSEIVPGTGCYVNVTVTVRCDSKLYYLHYVNEDFLIQVKDNKHFYYGLGSGMETDWQHVIRDIHIDTQKGASFKGSATGQGSQKKSSKSHLKIPKSKLIIESLTISLSPGTTLLLDNLTIASAEHMAQFYQAADWFVFNQNEMGGWPIPVKRKFASSDFPAVLEPGWNSAMGQGHALSLLSRAYYFSNSSVYKSALIKAVSQIFELGGLEQGVRTKFLDKYVWFEEYPTTPSSFVLNGFMYALLGLYDLKMVNVSGGVSSKAGRLYDEGIYSLKALLPLFDTGSGTMYDLRHFTAPGVPPNLARIDYHVTHINQLLTFATFEDDSIFKTTAERWIDYTVGKRAPHN